MSSVAIPYSPGPICAAEKARAWKAAAAAAAAAPAPGSGKTLLPRTRCVPVLAEMCAKMGCAGTDARAEDDAWRSELSRAQPRARETAAMERRGRSPTPRDRSRRAASGQSAGKRVAGDSRSDSRSSARRKRSRSRSRTPKVGNKSSNTSKSTTRGSVSGARNEGYENRRRGSRYASQRGDDVSEVLIRKGKNNRRGLPAPALAPAPAPAPAPGGGGGGGGGVGGRANGSSGPSSTGTSSGHRNHPRYDSNRRDIFSGSKNSNSTRRTSPVREHRSRDSKSKLAKDAKNTGTRADSDVLVSSSSSTRRTSPVREHRSRDSESKSARRSTNTGTHADSDALVSSSSSTRRTSPVREHRSRDSKSRSAKNSTNAGKSTGSDALVSDAALAKWKRPAYSGSSLNNAVLVELRALEQSRQYGDGKHKVLHLQKVADRFDEVAELRERFRPLIVEECVQIVAGELRPLARRHNATTYMLQLLESPPPKSSKAVSVRFKVLTPISTIAHRTMHESTPYLVRAKRANANWLVGMVAKKSHTMSDGILVLDMLLPVELGFDAVLSAGTEYEARPGPGLVMFERMYSVKVKKLPFMRKILGMKEPKHVLFSDSDSETNAAADGPKSVSGETKDVTKAVSGAQGNQALVTAFENSPFRASLNVSQKEAITSVLREDHVSSAQKIFMWQGPPGSGKSSTLSRLLGFLCSQFDQSSATKGTGPTSSAHRIMVCGPSNQSVHVLVDKLRETCSTYGIRCPEIALSAVNDSVPARLQELFVHGVFMEWARRFRKLVGQLSVASAEAELKILLDSIWTRVPNATKAFRVTRDYLGVLTRTYALAVRRQERAAARDKTREEQASDDDTSEVVVVKPLQVRDDGKSTPSQSEAPQSAAPKISPLGDSAASSTLEKATLGSEKETLTRRWQAVDPEDEEASDYDGVVEIVEERRGRAVSSGPPAKVENKFDSRTLFHLLEENRTKVLQSVFGALRLLVIQPGPLRKFPRAKVVYVRSGFIVDDDGDVVMDRNRSCVGKHGSDFFVSEDEIIQHIPRDAEWIITMRSSLDFLQTCPAVANYLARFTSRSLAALMEELSQADSAPESSASSQGHRAGGISDAVQQPSASSSKGAVFVVRDRSSSILSQTSKLSEQIIMDSDDSEDEAETTEAVASKATTSVQQTSGARKAPVAKPQRLSPVMESRVTSKRAQSGESSTADGGEDEVSSSKSSSDSDSDSDSSSSSSSSSSDSSSSDSSDDSSDESDNSAARAKRRKRSGEQGAFLEPIRQSFEAFAAALEELSNSRAAEQEFLQTAEVLFCTLAVSGRKSVRAANEAAGLSFLIIDEAAQAVEAETWVALQSVPDRMLLVGDPKQLSATVTSSVAQDLGFGRSLMERLMWGLSLPYHLLKVQYRMHPDISRFPVRFFYNNELEDGTNVRGPSPDWFAARGLMDPWYGPYAFLDVPNGREERQGRGSSYYNDAEAEIVARLAQNLVQRGVDVAKELIVITFYSGQVRTIATALSRHHIRNVVVSTVDSFQGSEASVVILSFVRANREGRVGFLSDLRRLNVALTRAKHSLILVGCGETLSRADDSCMRDLIKDARDRNVYKQLDNAQQPRGIPQVQSRPAHNRPPPPIQPWPQAPPWGADPRFQSWAPHNMLPTPFQPWPQTPPWGVDPRYQAQPPHNRQPHPVPPWSRSSHSRVAPNLQSRPRSRSPLRRDYRGKNAHSDRR